MEFVVPEDIANRALQYVGADLLDPVQGFSENSRNARQASFMYGKLRQVELHRNTWRFSIREAALRPVDTSTFTLMPTLFSPTTTYFFGCIVEDADGTLWTSRIASNLGNDPLNTETRFWEPYFGPLSVTPYDSTQNYFAGELVYIAAGDGTYDTYISLFNSNDADPAVPDDWVTTTVYNNNDVVQAAPANTLYMSTIDLNFGNTPASSPSAWTTSFVGGGGNSLWRQIGGPAFPNGVSLAPLRFVYPIKAGPFSQSTTRNIFRLPAGYLRPATQDPRAGSVSYLGAPSGNPYMDWKYENEFIVSTESQPIIFRFVADITDVTKMTPLFCEGLAARIAVAICETLTQSASKASSIQNQYMKFMTEARIINGIEIGPEEPPLDDYLACRA